MGVGVGRWQVWVSAEVEQAQLLLLLLNCTAPAAICFCRNAWHTALSKSHVPPTCFLRACLAVGLLAKQEYVIQSYGTGNGRGQVRALGGSRAVGCSLRACVALALTRSTKTYGGSCPSSRLCWSALSPLLQLPCVTPHLHPGSSACSTMAPSTLVAVATCSPPRSLACSPLVSGCAASLASCSMRSRGPM